MLLQTHDTLSPFSPPPAEPWLHAASGIAIGFACSKVVQWTEQKQKVLSSAFISFMPPNLASIYAEQEQVDRRAGRALHEKSHAQ
jgi:hypothetical protein